MISEKYTTKTKYGERNLNWAFEEYFERTCREKSLEEETLELIYSEKICPNVDPDIPATEYADIYMFNLYYLFERIKESLAMSSGEFRKTYRDYITGPLESYLEEYTGETDPLWGIWYKAEDYPGGKSACMHDLAEECEMVTTLSGKEIELIKRDVMVPDIAGEYTGCALMLFTGASLPDLHKARFKDILEMEKDSPDKMIHYRGTFPKFTEPDENDIWPRFVPLADKLRHVLDERRFIIDGFIKAMPEAYPEIKNAGDLPVACFSTIVENECSDHQLSLKASEILRNAAVDELRVSFLNCRLLDEIDLQETEGSGSLLMLRKTFTTGIYFSKVEYPAVQYLTGLKIDDEEDRDQDYAGTEFMHRIKEIIENTFWRQ